MQNRKIGIIPLSDKYPLIRQCNCCYEWQEFCSYYCAGVHRRHIQEIATVLKNNKDKFNKKDYEQLLAEIAKIFKNGNIYLIEEKFVPWVMGEIE